MNCDLNCELERNDQWYVTKVKNISKQKDNSQQRDLKIQEKKDWNYYFLLLRTNYCNYFNYYICAVNLMVNCTIRKVLKKNIVNDKKIISGLYLYTLDKHFISEVIFEICEGTYFFKFILRLL